MLLAVTAGQHMGPQPCVLLRQFVFQAHKCLGTSGVPLTGTSTEQLPVDSPRFVTLGGNHVEAAKLGNASVQANIRTPSGHVRGNGNGAFPAGMGDDASFFIVLDGIENLMIQVFGCQKVAEMLARPYAAGTDKDRTAGLMNPPNLIHNRFPFFGSVGKYPVRKLHPFSGSIRRNGHKGQMIDLPELGPGLGSRAGHSRKLSVEPEKPLEADPG